MKQVKDFSPYKIIISELKTLRSKEALVVESRFGLKGDQTTLAKIGRDLNLSRERIRQIEKEALKKLSVNIVKNHQKDIENIIVQFNKNGGLIAKTEASKMIMILKNHQNKKENRALDLFIYLLPQIELIEGHNAINDTWMMNDINKEDMVKILKSWVNYLSQNKKPQKIDLLLKKQPDSNKYKASFLLSLPKVSREIIETYAGELALSNWPECNPKTVRDKIFYVLKKNQSPMHFSEITRAIKQEEFDQKRVVTATVHNELISDKRFVLVGRGIYALAVWGYSEGTVKDIIKKILKQAGGVMDLSDIYKDVLKQRMVRKNTVLINLQTQKIFKKIGNNKYILA